MYYGVEDQGGGKQDDNPLDIDRAGFKPNVFMDKMLKDSSLTELYKQEERMKKGEEREGRGQEEKGKGMVRRSELGYGR